MQFLSLILVESSGRRATSFLKSDAMATRPISEEAASKKIRQSHPMLESEEVFLEPFPM
jgi:hypothetical protein